MTNKFASTYRSLESSNYFFGSYMTNGRQRVNTSWWCYRELYDSFGIMQYMRRCIAAQRCAQR